MKEATVIIHGWSDCSRSFEKLKKFLIRKGMGSVQTILFADYESREDNITFEDVADGLNDEFVKRGLIDAKGNKRVSLNVICHSTGALVIRHWLWRYYLRDGNRIEDCPVKRIVMLAPANFGSHLAHRGKSFFGSLIKGRKTFGDFFETGRQILEGLELGSPYQWNLAHRDLIQDSPYFCAEQIQVTILVGIEGFGGIAQLANRPGTDGTVMIAGASLDSAKLVLDFSRPEESDPEIADYNPYQWSINNPKDDFAFGVLEDLNHGSIVSASYDEAQPLSQILLRALCVKSSSAFAKLQKELEALTKSTYRSTQKPRYQQFLLRAVDDQDMPVRDFTVDFFICPRTKGVVCGEVLDRKKLTQDEMELSMRASELLSAHFHTHTRDTSHRSFLVDLEAVENIMQEARARFGTDAVMSMKIYVPRIDEGIEYDTRVLQNIVLHRTGAKSSQAPSFFYENTTTLIELRVNRMNKYVTVGSEPRSH